MKLAALAFVCLATTNALAAPKVSQADARKIALGRVPGTIVHEKLKHKKDHDLYFIEIKPTKSATLKKVEIDAESGAVVKIKDVKAKSKPDD
jgi:uncharacterized membrane protein YkoI